MGELNNRRVCEVEDCRGHRAGRESAFEKEMKPETCFLFHFNKCLLRSYCMPCATLALGKQDL